MSNQRTVVGGFDWGGIGRAIAETLEQQSRPAEKTPQPEPVKPNDVQKLTSRLEAFEKELRVLRDDGKALKAENAALKRQLADAEARRKGETAAVERDVASLRTEVGGYKARIVALEAKVGVLTTAQSAAAAAADPTKGLVTEVAELRKKLEDAASSVTALREVDAKQASSIRDLQEYVSAYASECEKKLADLDSAVAERGSAKSQKIELKLANLAERVEEVDLSVEKLEERVRKHFVKKSDFESVLKRLDD